MLYLLANVVGGALQDPTAEYWSRTLPMHPKLVHVPIALCIVMPLVAMMIWIGVRRGWFSAHTWIIATVLQAVLFGAGLVAIQTGEDDAEKVEGYASEEALQAHAERATTFVYVAGLNLVLSGAVLLLSRHRRPQHVLGAIAIAGTLIGGYAGYRVGDAGGRLVYVGNASDAHK